MKRAVGIVCLCMLAATTAIAAETVRIITKENAIRSGARFFAPVRAKLYYNDTVTVISRDGDWMKVRFKGTDGYLHKSAVKGKSVGLSALGSGGGGTSSDEVALAGKGFNPQVEASYRKGHPELDFRAVDKIERFQVADRELEQFITQGGLNAP